MITLGLDEVVRLVGEFRSEQLVGTAEVASELDVDVVDVQEWTRKGLLPASRVNGRLVFHVRDLAEFKLHAMVNLDSYDDLDPEPEPMDNDARAPV